MSFVRSVGRVDAVESTWMGARPLDWAQRDESWDATFGVAGILFEVGVGRSGWLARLAASDWFSGFAPRPEDLTADEEASGSWTLAAEAGEAGVVACLTSSHVPHAPWWTAIAVTPETSAAQRPAVLGLVSALRQRRSKAGDPLPVVVTIEGSLLHDEPFISELLERGAFVIRPGRDVGGDHLHHFPLRAFAGDPRLICIDLFDTLSLWRPGRTATLHLIPSNPEKAAQCLDSVPVPPGGAWALDLRFHPRADYSDVTLDSIDQLAIHCQSRCLGPDGDSLVTEARRLDGASGTADLLIIDQGTC